MALLTDGCQSILTTLTVFNAVNDNRRHYRRHSKRHSRHSSLWIYLANLKRHCCISKLLKVYFFLFIHFRVTESSLRAILNHLGTYLELYMAACGGAPVILPFNNHQMWIYSFRNGGNVRPDFSGNVIMTQKELGTQNSPVVLV